MKIIELTNICDHREIIKRYENFSDVYWKAKHRAIPKRCGCGEESKKIILMHLLGAHDRVRHLGAVW